MTDNYTLSILVENHASVLSKVVGLFSRRGFNIYSLSVGPTNDPTVSRITIDVGGDEKIVEQISKQISKLIDVIKIKTLRPEMVVKRCLVLAKIKTTSKSRSEILEIANVFRAKVVDIALNTISVEITGDTSKVDAFIELMEQFGVEEIARTGVTALERGANTLKAGQ